MDDQEQIEQPIEEESPLEQRVIPFMGDELAAALTESGGIFISLPGMCNALGLNVRGQTQRIRRTKELLVGLRRIPLMTRGGRQEINCLRLDQLGLWLAGIETARVSLTSAQPGSHRRTQETCRSASRKWSNKQKACRSPSPMP
jgi:hypothetical protein